MNAGVFALEIFVTVSWWHQSWRPGLPNVVAPDRRRSRPVQARVLRLRLLPGFERTGGSFLVVTSEQATLQTPCSLTYLQGPGAGK